MKKTWIAWPYMCWAAVFTLVPMFLIVYYGFSVVNENGEIVFSLANYKEFFQSEIYMAALWRSLWFSAVATIICLIIGYPVAYILARSDFKNKNFLLSILVVPMWMNLLLRTYAWMMLLDNNGLINSLLSLIGIGNIKMLYNEQAIIFGMVYNFLPFMIYPIYNTLQKMDRSLIEAAQDLGANPFQVFMKTILPLSMPGVMSGIVMVFMPTVSTFAIAELLTMNNIKLFGTTVQENIYNGMWNYGAALSLIMLLLIGVTILFTNEEDSASNEGGGVI